MRLDFENAPREVHGYSVLDRYAHPDALEPIGWEVVTPVGSWRIGRYRYHYEVIGPGIRAQRKSTKGAFDLVERAMAAHALKACEFYRRVTGSD